MSEFQDKVQQYKQTIVDTGFKTDDVPTIEGSAITDVPTINVDESDQQDLPQNNENQQETPKKAGRKTVEGLKKRIDQVTFERNVREAQAQELMARVQEQERRLAEQEALLAQNEQHKNAYYENNLFTRENAIINELKVAKEEGNIDKEIELSKELAKVAADKSTHGLYKSQLNNQPRYEPSPVPNYPYNNQSNLYPEPTYGRDLHSPNNYEEPINEAYDNWLDKNPWADPESQNYSPRLRDEAVSLANELDEMLRYNGNSEYIGTPKYFDSIDNLMSERYGIQSQNQTQNNEYQEPKPRESQSYSVAPVSRSGSSMADQYMTKNPNNTRRHMSLSEDEYKIARNLQIKLPSGKYATGDEAVRRYAEAKRMQNPSGSQKLVIE